MLRLWTLGTLGTLGGLVALAGCTSAGKEGSVPVIVDSGVGSDGETQGAARDGSQAGDDTGAPGAARDGSQAGNDTNAQDAVSSGGKDLGASPPPPRGPTAVTIFDGSEREILYRTSSHAGSSQLEELLHMIPGGEKFTVLKMPYKWTDEQKAQYPVQVRRMNNNFKPGFVIEDENDTAGIAAGMEELQKAAAEDLALGIKAIFYHTGHYNENSTDADNARYIFNTRLAYRALQQQNNDARVRFIDCMTPTKENFPATVRRDGFHASKAANYLEGLEIVKAMAAHDGIALPGAVQARVEQKVAEATTAAEAISVDYPSLEDNIGETVHAGDTITVRWDVEEGAVPGVYVMLHAIFNDDYYLSDRILADDPSFGTFTWTAGVQLPSAGNKPGRILPQNAKSERITSKDAENSTFAFRIINSDLEKADDVYAFSARFRIELSGQPRPVPKHFEIMR